MRQKNWKLFPIPRTWLKKVRRLTLKKATTDNQGIHPLISGGPLQTLGPLRANGLRPITRPIAISYRSLLL